MIEKDLLKEYIAFARTCVHPKLNGEAIEELVQAYGTLRQNGRDRKVRGRRSRGIRVYTTC